MDVGFEIFTSDFFDFIKIRIKYDTLPYTGEYIYPKSEFNYYDQIPVNPFKKKSVLSAIKFSACSLNFWETSSK